jgi:murein DD-endopeptidase MepM/ murein hydrolase activator NlpD
MKKYTFILAIIISLFGIGLETRSFDSNDLNHYHEPDIIQFPMSGYQTDLDFGVYNPNTRKYHAAEDAFDPAGTPVYAMADGIISYSGYMYGYGYLTIVDHPDLNVYSLYGHLSTRRWKKWYGAVEKGELIAYLGDEDENTGGDYTLPPHLHFGIRRGSRYDYPSGRSDDRYMAGWTFAYPTILKWLDPSEFIEEIQEITNVSEDKNIYPSSIELYQNTPNPFNHETTFRYNLPEDAHIRISIYSIFGQEMAELMNATQNAGSYQITWDAAEIPSGTYLIRMEAEKFARMRKCILMK